MKSLLLALVIFVTTSAFASSPPSERLNNPAQEARAVALTHKLRCVVCQNESIAESHADMARDMRILVRKQILEGRSDQEIIDWLQARYGDFILLNPPFATRTWLLWLTPLIVLSAGALLIYPNIRRRDR